MFQFKGAFTDALYSSVTKVLYLWWLLHLLSIQIDTLMKRFCVSDYLLTRSRSILILPMLTASSVILQS